MSQITWRNVNQDTGIRDALAATTAAQNSFNGSMSALDKVLGQQQQLAQNVVDDKRQSNMNRVMGQIESNGRTTKDLRDYVDSGEYNQDIAPLTPKQQAEVIPLFNKYLNNAPQLENLDRTSSENTLLYDNRNDLYAAESIGFRGTEEEKEAYISNIASIPDLDLRRNAETRFLKGMTDAQDVAKKNMEFNSRIGLADANTKQALANASLTNTNAQGRVIENYIAQETAPDVIAGSRAEGEVARNNIVTAAREGANPNNPLNPKNGGEWNMEKSSKFLTTVAPMLANNKSAMTSVTNLLSGIPENQPVRLPDGKVMNVRITQQMVEETLQEVVLRPYSGLWGSTFTWNKDINNTFMRQLGKKAATAKAISDHLDWNNAFIIPPKK